MSSVAPIGSENAVVTHNIKGADELVEDGFKKAQAIAGDVQDKLSMKTACLCCNCVLGTRTIDKESRDFPICSCGGDGNCIFAYCLGENACIMPRMCCGCQAEYCSCKNNDETFSCVGKPIKLTAGAYECCCCRSAQKCGVIPIPYPLIGYNCNICIFNSRMAIPCTKQVPLEVGCCNVMCVGKKAGKEGGAPVSEIMDRDGDIPVAVAQPAVTDVDLLDKSFVPLQYTEKVW